MCQFDQAGVIASRFPGLLNGGNGGTGTFHFDVFIFHAAVFVVRNEQVDANFVFRLEAV